MNIVPELVPFERTLLCTGLRAKSATGQGCNKDGNAEYNTGPESQMFVVTPAAAGGAAMKNRPRPVVTAVVALEANAAAPFRTGGARGKKKST